MDMFSKVNVIYSWGYSKKIMSFASIGGEGYTYRKLSRKGGLVKNMMMFKEEVSPHKLMKVIIG
jgi:hypothetical protein